MRRTASMVMVLVFALGGLATIVPTTSGQSDEVRVDDPLDDVAPAAGWGDGDVVHGEPANAISSDVSGPVDLTGFRVFEETPTHLNFEWSVADFSRPDTWQPATTIQTLCFTWSGTGSVYRFSAVFTYDSRGAQTEPNKDPKFGGAWFERMPDDQCQPHIYDGAGAWAPVMRMGPFTWVIDVDLDDGVVTARLPRALFEMFYMGGGDSPKLDPRPLAGDTLTNIQAHAYGKAFNGHAYYDNTGSADFVFKMDTGNDKVKVLIPRSVSAGYGVGGYDTPLYGVELGSYQTVPVTIENHLDVPIEPNLTARILSGDSANWDVRTLPSIPVPAMKDGEPGRTVVTMIVNSADTIAHKEAVRVVVEALDPAQPYLGAQAVDIVGVVPPTVEASTLYFHRSGNPCQAQGKWFNTLAVDSTAPADEIAFHTCDRDGGRMFTNNAGYTFKPDVPLERNYVLSTTTPARATLDLRSIVEPPGSSDDSRIPVPMTADVTVQVLEGSSVIGETTLENVAIGSDYATVEVNIDILGRILGGFGREVSDEKGLGIRIWLSAKDKVYEYGGCVGDQTCTPQGQFQMFSVTGKVLMALGGKSKIDLPIASTERSGEVYDITATGALISLRLPEDEAKYKYVNPGGVRVFNVTVRNEGMNVDTARIKAVVDEGWKAEIIPSTSYKLKVGEPRSFNVRVTAPLTSEEGDKLRLDVVATSTVDPEARASMPLTVEVTTGELFDDDVVDGRLKADEHEESAAPSLVAFLALALVGLALRRRRP